MDTRTMDTRTVQVLIPEQDTTLSYSVVVGKGLLAQLPALIDLSRYTSVAVIVDRNVVRPWLETLVRGLPSPVGIIEVDASEHNKEIREVERVIEQLKLLRVDRRSLILNLGGGMVGDLGGFAASIYMRGLDFVQIPTTLLSQVDASVGGKVGVNFRGVKNLIGAFNQPVKVIADIDTLRTLPDRELRSGYAEVLKHGLIRSQEYFAFAASRDVTALSERDLLEIIEGSCKIKARVVEEDEREGGVRKVLNFGHTLGHAFEILSFDTDQPLLHGEAIALGMIGEGWLSVQQGLITTQQLNTMEQAFRSAGLPVRLPAPIDPHAISERIQYDKKTAGGAVYWTLLAGIGSAVWDRHVAAEQVKAAIAYVSRPE